MSEKPVRVGIIGAGANTRSRHIPGFRAISVRPGVIDTDMQRFARSQTPEVLPAVALFQGFHRAGQLVPPATTARVIVDRLILAPVDHGRTYTYQDLASGD